MITTHALSKTYGGRTVVDSLELRVPEGCVYGFLGPNGSGKTTTMKMLLSLVQPSHGDITIMRHPMTRNNRRALLNDIGSLIELPPGYGHLTGRENLRVVQRLTGANDHDIDRAVSTVRLQDNLDKRVRQYSLGMKQRLGIAMALARRPQLLILDEPTNGLDPAGIEEIRELVKQLAANGVTIMVSSHLLGEIDRTANVLGILSRGRLLFQGTREELFTRATPDLLLETAEPERAMTVTAAMRPVRDGGSVRIAGIDQTGTAKVISQLVHEGIDIFSVRRDEQSLEDIFMELTTGGGL